jgi:hypothetical protein
MIDDFAAPRDGVAGLGFKIIQHEGLNVRTKVHGVVRGLALQLANLLSVQPQDRGLVAVHENRQHRCCDFELALGLLFCGKSHGHTPSLLRDWAGRPILCKILSSGILVCVAGRRRTNAASLNARPSVKAVKKSRQ